MPELGNLFHSAQAALMLEAYSRIVAYISEYDQDFENVADLGCWAGCLSRIIATRWPKLNVYGLDRACPMMDALQKSERPDNLSFHCVDIEDPDHINPDSVDLLVSCFGLFLHTKDTATATRRIATDTADVILVEWADEEFVPDGTTRWDEGILELINEMTNAGWEFDETASTDIQTKTSWGRAVMLVFHGAKTAR